MPTSDLELLLELNRDYIRSVQNSDVRRFDEILAEDFLCSNPDGSLVDRQGFLAQTARPIGITGLEAHDVKVRIMGNVALIHARTSYTLPGRAGWRRTLYRCLGTAQRELARRLGACDEMLDQRRRDNDAGRLRLQHVASGSLGQRGIALFRRTQ